MGTNSTLFGTVQICLLKFLSSLPFLDEKKIVFVMFLLEFCVFTSSNYQEESSTLLSSSFSAALLIILKHFFNYVSSFIAISFLSRFCEFCAKLVHLNF